MVGLYIEPSHLLAQSLLTRDPLVKHPVLVLETLHLLLAQLLDLIRLVVFLLQGVLQVSPHICQFDDFVLDQKRSQLEEALAHLFSHRASRNAFGPYLRLCQRPLYLEANELRDSISGPELPEKREVG